MYRLHAIYAIQPMFSPEVKHRINPSIIERDPLLSRQKHYESHAANIENLSTPKETNNAEFYGYAIYIMTGFAFFVYLLWAYVPDEYLDAIGWTYYPNKQWAISIPAFLFMFMFFVLAYHAGYVLYNTPDITSFQVLTDECVSMRQARESSCPLNSIPPFEDVPVYQVDHNQVFIKNHEPPSQKSCLLDF
jgi:phosphatidylinositol glycan class P protein